MQTLDIPGVPVRVAAKLLSVHKDTLYKKVRNGTIKGELDPCDTMVIPFDELVYLIRKAEDELTAA